MLAGMMALSGVLQLPLVSAGLVKVQLRGKQCLAQVILQIAREPPLFFIPVDPECGREGGRRHFQHICARW
jgi:hypothetical protein